MTKESKLKEALDAQYDIIDETEEVRGQVYFANLVWREKLDTICDILVALRKRTFRIPLKTDPSHHFPSKNSVHQ